MLAEVERGWRRMEALFGPGALPIFVPPWNRICPAVVSGLASRGLSAVSVFLPRQDAFAAPGVLQVNTHLDPICWRRGGRPAEPGKLATLVLDHLRSRRKAHVDNIEPYGLLTHHLASDTATWDFVATLVDVLVSSGVARWTSPLDAH